MRGLGTKASGWMRHERSASDGDGLASAPVTSHRRTSTLQESTIPELQTSASRNSSGSFERTADGEVSPLTPTDTKWSTMLNFSQTMTPMGNRVKKA